MNIPISYSPIESNISQRDLGANTTATSLSSSNNKPITELNEGIDSIDFKNASNALPNNQIANSSLSNKGIGSTYGSVQERLLSWILRLAKGDQSVFDEALAPVNESFIESSTQNFPNILGLGLGAASGFNLNDTYSDTVINAELKTSGLFDIRRFLNNVLETIQQGSSATASLLKSVMGVSSEEASKIAPDIVTSITEKFPNLISMFSQTSAKIQSREDGFANIISMGKALKQKADDILKEAIKLGGNP